MTTVSTANLGGAAAYQGPPQPEAVALRTPDNGESLTNNAPITKDSVARVVGEALSAAGQAVPQPTHLTIRADAASGRYVYEFRDPATDKIVAQYPDKVVLEALAASGQNTRGLLASGSA